MQKTQELTRKQTYRNYVLLIIEGIFFTVGMVFFDTNTILPLLMEKLTGSAIMVGFIGTAPALGMGLTSLLAGNWVRPYRYKKRFIVTISSLGRLPLWILGLSLLFITTKNVYFWGTLIIGIQLMFWLADGAVYSAWSDLIGKSINSDSRGRFLGSMQIIGGIIAIMAGGIVNRILNLEYLSFPGNYGLILSIGAFLFTISVLSFAGVIEKPSSTGKRENIINLLKLIPHYFKTVKPFSLAMTVLFFSNIALISFPFYITYARTNFGLKSSDVGILISSQIIGKMLGGLFLGFIGDKAGHEKAVLCFAVSSLIPPLMAMVLGTTVAGNSVLIISIIIFFFLGMFKRGWIGFINYIIDLVPDHQRTLYTGLMNLIRIPAAILPVLGGLLVSAYGYTPVFVIAFSFTIIGIIIAFKLPPTGRIE